MRNMKKSISQILEVKPEIRNNNKDKWCLRQFSYMHSSRSSELTVYKVIHGYLQYHHHHWRHHHRCHHNQHDVHQLFQSNSILRVPKTRSPPHAMPSFSSWDGLPLEDFRWLQLNTKVIRRLSLYSYSLSSFAFTSFSMITIDDTSRIVSTCWTHGICRACTF